MKEKKPHISASICLAFLLGLLWCCLPFTVQAQEVVAVADTLRAPTDSTTSTERMKRHPVLYPSGDTVKFVQSDSLILAQATITPDTAAAAGLGKIKKFNPDPMRAMWLSALCPGLGQIYNRRYWKLPIVVGAFMGMGYGTAWNTKMYNDYTQAYRDITDDDPNTKSYMDFFPPTVKEEDLDTTWLTKALQNKRNSYRRYREMCIIGLVAVYLINIVDAYVDASLAHFDLSSDLTMDVRPSSIETPLSRVPALGLQCALTF